MKKRYLISLVLLLFISCSKDDKNKEAELFGVWEAVNLTNIYKLVFTPDHIGLKIDKIIDATTGNEVSSLSEFTWIKENEKVTLTKSDFSEDTYIIDANGNLKWSASNNIVLTKVSEDYSKY